MSQPEERRGVQFNIIHLSDLHMGMNGLRWMWPALKAQFFSDLRQQYQKTGPWDLVVFSGDLTQRASPQEYADLTAALSELWGVFNELGCTPKLFVVPGNHDLHRPQTIDAHALALGLWWQTPQIHQDFWENTASDYRRTVTTAFDAYTSWIGSLDGSAIPVLKDQCGLLPGDVSARLHKDSASIGLIGLNSAWLQLSDRRGQGSLSVDPRQLLGVTGGDPDAWVGSNAFNLVVTHHPTTWLHPEALKLWNAEIHVNSRFDAHLFGHMHEAVGGQSAINGGPGKLILQAPSIFGLETTSEGVQRNHGYTVLQLARDVDGATLTIFPRLAFQRSDGSRRLIDDPHWDLVGSACVLALQPRRTKPLAATAVIATTPTDVTTIAQDGGDRLSSSTPLIDTSGADRILGGLKRSSVYSRAAASVRKEEQQFVLAALRSDRMSWLVDTWGTGGDEFVSVVGNRLLGTSPAIYVLPVGTFEGQEAFLSMTRQRLGCGVEQLFQALDQRPCVLVLDDVCIESGNRLQLEQDLLHIVSSLLSFSERLHVIIRARARPLGPSPFTQLRPLDEADVTAYVASHDPTSTLPPDALARIFRHSGGLPTRIDAILRSIDVVGTQALYDLDVDIAGKAAARPDDIPQALVESIKELTESEDEHSRRAAMLLKVLSLFPQGEPLARVRRFFGPKAFWVSHATLLLERGLIDSNPITSLEGAALSREQGNALTVRRPVREYLVQTIPANELKGLNSKALSLYFGDSWAERGIQSPSDLKFSSQRCGTLEIDNAITLILREARAATESGNAGRIKAALALAESFVGQLNQGNHFRSGAQFLDGAVKIFEDHVASAPLEQASKEPLNLAHLLEAHASALRMINQVDRAHRIASEIILDGQSKSLKENVLLTIAMCKEQLKAPADEIIAAAEACRKVNPKGQVAISARYVIVCAEQAPDRTARLRALHDEARRKNCSVVANNIALELASTTSDSEQKKRHLMETLESGRANDHYNFVRALMRVCKQSLAETGTITRQQFNECAQAYSYLYNQRMDSLFEACHRILWDVFKARGDQQNLLTLYRYSSLVWRLHKKVDREQGYRNEMTAILGNSLSKSILAADRELRYFISRGATAAGEIPSPQA